MYKKRLKMHVCFGINRGIINIRLVIKFHYVFADKCIRLEKGSFPIGPIKTFSKTRHNARQPRKVEHFTT